MKGIFIGPLLHWLIVIALVALGWIGGSFRFHVSEFNPFLILLIAIVVLVLLVVVMTSGIDRRVTRDPITDNSEEDAG
ncbi:MAG: hypothetical protein AAF557_08245 [Pseudomonadota bacterium]